MERLTCLASTEFITIDALIRSALYSVYHLMFIADTRNVEVLQKHCLGHLSSLNSSKEHIHACLLELTFVHRVSNNRFQQIASIVIKSLAL